MCVSCKRGDFCEKVTFRIACIADGSMLYYDFTTDKHTPSEVSCFVYGFDPHFERFYTEQSPSTIKNKNIFDIMLDLLQNPKQES